MTFIEFLKCCFLGYDKDCDHHNPHCRCPDAYLVWGK